MADLNSFAFTGRLTKDAAIKNVNGKTLMELDVANNVGYGDYAKTNWLKVKMWGERCNNIAPIFKKGSLVTGQGELSTNEWTSNNTGEKHIDLVVTVMNIQILVSKKAENAEEPEDSIKDNNEEPEDSIKDNNEEPEDSIKDNNEETVF